MAHASQLDDAGGACRDNDDAAERGGNEQSDAERRLAVEDEERDGHRPEILEDEDEHQHQRHHQDDHGCPDGARARSPVADGLTGSRGVSDRRLGGRYRFGRVGIRSMLRVRHECCIPDASMPNQTRPGAPRSKHHDALLLNRDFGPLGSYASKRSLRRTGSDPSVRARKGGTNGTILRRSTGALHR
jgi:hypothetical protein